jgi:hypothetical protein
MTKSTRNFLSASALLLTVFLLTVNFTTYPGHLWAIWTTPALLTAPLFFLLSNNTRRHLTAFSIASTIITLGTLVVTNMLETPDYWWFLYAVPALLVWPTVMLGGKKSSTPSFAFVVSAIVTAAYIALNIYFEPRFPWSIFTTFALLWWPFGVALAKKPRALSLFGASWVTLLALVVNFVTTPETTWWIYPVFSVMFWPFGVFLARRTLTFSIIMTTWIALFFGLLNAMLTPTAVWWIYPAFAMAFWPLSVYFFVTKRKEISAPTSKK